MVLTQNNLEFEGLLYPLMVIAAVAVIVFSLLGIANMSGLLPPALTAPEPVQLSSTVGDTPAAAFACAECGVIESLKLPEKLAR